jgi:hypothetical protein
MSAKLAKRPVPVNVTAKLSPPTLELPLQEVQSHPKFQAVLDKPSLFPGCATAAQVPASTVIGPGVGALPVKPTLINTSVFPPPESAHGPAGVLSISSKVYVIDVWAVLTSTVSVPMLGPVVHGPQ